jgi:hypothetical protein
MPSTPFDSAIFRDTFGTPAMRAVFCDDAAVRRYVEVEVALAAEARAGVIPVEATEAIGRGARPDAIDLAKLKAETDIVGYPIGGLETVARRAQSRQQDRPALVKVRKPTRDRGKASPAALAALHVPSDAGGAAVGLGRNAQAVVLDPAFCIPVPHQQIPVGLPIDTERAPWVDPFPIPAAVAPLEVEPRAQVGLDARIIVGVRMRGAQ